MACCAFDCLPDALVLLILDRIADAKTITRCAAVSLRLHFLLRHVHHVVLKPNHMPSSHSNTFSRLCGRILKKTNPVVENDKMDRDSNATQLRKFEGVKFIRIELPSPELALENVSILKWSASFGATLVNCVVLGATSVVCPGGTNEKNIKNDICWEENSPRSPDENVIPESFYTNGGLKSRVVWTISSLIAASARHYSAQPIIKQHKTLESLILNDACGQGVLRMGREHLEEVRRMRSVSLSRERTILPDLEMWMWYMERVEMGDGSVLTGVTLGVIRPKGKTVLKEGFMDGDWIERAFEEPFASVAKVVMKRRSYKVDIGSF